MKMAIAAAMAAVVSGGLATAAHAQGTATNRLSQFECTSIDCETQVLVDLHKGSTGNSCGIRAVDVILVTNSTRSLAWKLVNDDGAPDTRYQFKGGVLAAGSATDQGVKINDNVYGPNAPSTTDAASKVFTDAQQTTSATTPPLIADRHIVKRAPLPAGTKYFKPFKFGIYLQFRLGGDSRWIDCDPLDPIIIDHSD